MKIRVTEKQIKENFKNIIHIGYCNIQSLLNYKDPDFYTCGVYGWNSDIYKINNSTVIVTGYRPFGNISVNYEIQQKYENKAREILYNYNIEYEKRSKKLDQLLNKFIEEALKNGIY